LACLGFSLEHGRAGASTAIVGRLGLLGGAMGWLQLSDGSCFPLLRGIPAKIYELEAVRTFERIRKKMRRIK